MNFNNGCLEKQTIFLLIQYLIRQRATFNKRPFFVASCITNVRTLIYEFVTRKDFEQKTSRRKMIKCSYELDLFLTQKQLINWYLSSYKSNPKEI